MCVRGTSMRVASNNSVLRSSVAGVPKPRRFVCASARSIPSQQQDGIYDGIYDGIEDRIDRMDRMDAVKSLSPLLSLSLFLLANPALAEVTPPTSSPPASSYYVSLGLFLLTLPGLWSLIKRSPKAKIKRKTFEVEGPAVASHMPLDTRARQIFNYFKNYNYTVKETGEVIVFEGNYRASLGQAAALVLYTAISLASTALVLSIAAPFGGNWWYLMTLISPAAGAYYLKNAERTEEFQVKMTTSDDDKTTDITVQGDEEEIERFRKELQLMEKGMEYVKGILE